MNVFISPHLDDIAYSCYGAINNVSFPKLCMVVFSKSCYAFNKVNLEKKDEISAMRLKEEKRFLESLQTELLNLGYDDSSARSKLEIDTASINKDIRAQLLSIGPSSLYAPAGIGWHYDHIIIRNTVLSFWKEFHSSYSLYLYEDLPYACAYSKEEYIKELNKISHDNSVSFLPVTFDFNKYQLDWENIIKNVYKSQYNEVEFLEMKNFRESQVPIIERVWKCFM